MEKLDFLIHELSEDRSFFHQFKDNFINFFSEKAFRYSDNYDVSVIRSLADNLYNLLFLYDENPTEKLKNLIKESIRLDSQLKPVFSETFLYILKNYIDYIVTKKLNFEKIKNLVDLLDIYLFIIETAYLEYTKELEKTVDKIKKEKENDELNIIIHGFKKLIEENKKVQLISLYKEVPVICKGIIEDILLDKYINVKLDGCKYKNFYMENRYVFIKSDVFPTPVKTKIKESDIRSSKIKLKIISFEKIPQLKRKYIRVIPDENILVKMQTYKGEFIGKLADISIGGCGILFEDLPVSEIEPEQKVKLSCKLKKNNINLVGVIKSIEKLGRYIKIGIEFKLNDKLEEIISEYVVKRQFEIIKELKI